MTPDELAALSRANQKLPKFICEPTVVERVAVILAAASAHVTGDRT